MNAPIVLNVVLAIVWLGALAWIALRIRVVTRRNRCAPDMISERSKDEGEKRNYGDFFAGIVICLCGLSAAITGRGGFRDGY